MTPSAHRVGQLLALGGLLTLVNLASGPRASADQHDQRATERHVQSVSPVASYDISARLDAQTHAVQASAQIRLLNHSRAPLTSLWFHLYLNAFKNDDTLFLRSPFGAGRSGGTASHWGYIDVQSLKSDRFGDINLWDSASAHSPGDPADQTDIAVPLPSPLEPGQTLDLSIEFTSQLPQLVERTGYADSFHMVGQWFPKLAKLNQDGSFEHFAFHPNAEFYADYGNYTVSLDVPGNYRVGATGRRTLNRISGDRRQTRFVAEGVHDFAWTAWDQFAKKSATVDGVRIDILYPQGQDGVAELTLATLERALPHFQRRYGRYPYPTLTVVHPPSNAMSAGGMEYPTLITTGGPWFMPWLGLRLIEQVTVHELGHQWFYGLIASNEARWPFLDEGLNSYAEQVALDELFGTGSLVDWFDLTISSSSLQRTFGVAVGRDDVVAQPAASFPSFRAMSGLVYSRTATLLETFRRVYGARKLERALLRYARRFRYRHPEPEDFLSVIREELGEAAAANLVLGLFERGNVDYAVDSLLNSRKQPAFGVFDRPQGRKVLPKPDDVDAPGTWVTRVILHRRGSLHFPVEIELTTQEGDSIIRHWDGAGNSYTLDVEAGGRVVGAHVDPRHKVIMDDNLLNNSAAPSQTARYTSERAGYLAALLLAWLGP